MIDTELLAELLAELAGLDPQPESVPINALVPVEGTPMGDASPPGWDELVRVIAAARVMMDISILNLVSACGRTTQVLI